MKKSCVPYLPTPLAMLGTLDFVRFLDFCWVTDTYFHLKVLN